jgi:hypothetical protein
MRLADLHGIWVATEEADYVAYEVQTSKPHQAQIVLHEFAHMVLQHEPRSGEDLALHRRARLPYQAWEERHAEALASLLLQRIGLTPAPQLTDVLSPAAARVVGTFMAAEKAGKERGHHDQGAAGHLPVAVRGRARVHPAHA